MKRHHFESRHATRPVVGDISPWQIVEIRVLPAPLRRPPGRSWAGLGIDSTPVNDDSPGRRPGNPAETG